MARRFSRDEGVFTIPAGTANTVVESYITDGARRSGYPALTTGAARQSLSANIVLGREDRVYQDINILAGFPLTVGLELISIAPLLVESQEADV